jgi:hypothetical protein
MILRIVSMNIRQGGGDRVTGLADWLISKSPTAITLPEWRNNPSGERIRTRLTGAGLHRPDVALIEAILRAPIRRSPVVVNGLPNDARLTASFVAQAFGHPSTHILQREMHGQTAQCRNNLQFKLLSRRVGRGSPAFASRR